MTTATYTQGTRSAAILTLGALASGAYIESAVQDFGVNMPYDQVLEVECTPSTTTTGNKQLVVYARRSLDNTNWQGPTSAISSTNEVQLSFLGSVQVISANLCRNFYSLDQLPKARYNKFIAKNDMGVALTNGFMYLAPITANNA